MSRLARRLHLWTGLAFVIAALPSTLKADSIIFNNFGPGHSSNLGGWAEVGGQSPDVVAMAFTPNVTSTLGTIHVAIGWGGGDTSTQYTLALMTDNGGQPGSIVESWNVTSSFVGGVCSNCFETVFARQHVVLQAGLQYWIVPFPSSGFNGSWQDNNVGSIGTLAVSHDGGNTWSPPNASPVLGAFDVTSTVPEPSTLILLASGSLGIVGVARCRLRGIYRPSRK